MFDPPEERYLLDNNREESNENYLLNKETQIATIDEIKANAERDIKNALNKLNSQCKKLGCRFEYRIDLLSRDDVMPETYRVGIEIII